MNYTMATNGILLGGMAIATNYFFTLPPTLLGLSVGAGVLLTGAGMFKQDKLEEALQKITGNEGLYISNKEDKPYGYDVYIPLPVGMCLNDFQQIRDDVEQYLNAEVEFLYINKSIRMVVRTGAIERSYPFVLQETSGPVEIVVGYSREGLEVIDLTKAVHMLIAGETGSGKSVSLRSIITTLILTKTELHLNLVDFKRVELGIFRQSGRVKNFCRTIEEFDLLLDELTEESERRYSIFENKNLVNIQSWNKRYSPKLPYIITIVDEFASLQKEKEIMTKLTRRLEKDRACGIHYIVCTQRPSAKILSGDIKANIPTILSFKTSNRLNSQIILDEPGAEQLPGMGAGLLKHNGQIKRIQTMFLSETEAQKLIRHTFIKKERTKDNASGVIEIVDGKGYKGNRLSS